MWISISPTHFWWVPASTQLEHDSQTPCREVLLPQVLIEKQDTVYTVYILILYIFIWQYDPKRMEDKIENLIKNWVCFRLHRSAMHISRKWSNWLRGRSLCCCETLIYCICDFSLGKGCWPRSFLFKAFRPFPPMAWPWTHPVNCLKFCDENLHWLIENHLCVPLCAPGCIHLFGAKRSGCPKSSWNKPNVIGWTGCNLDMFWGNWCVLAAHPACLVLRVEDDLGTERALWRLCWKAEWF